MVQDEQHANTLTRFNIATIYKQLTKVMQHTMYGRSITARLELQGTPARFLMTSIPISVGSVACNSI